MKTLTLFVIAGDNYNFICDICKRSDKPVDKRHSVIFKPVFFPAICSFSLPACKNDCALQNSAPLYLI